jgi:hypothetical protein
MREDIISPLIYNQEEYHGYGVGTDTGDIYSSKLSDIWKKRKTCVSGKSPYPHCNITKATNVIKSIVQHIAVHETLKPVMPIPPGVSETVWKQTHQSVKRMLRHIWQVNHKDHDHLNYKPTNLEWTTGQENVNKYQQHRQRQHNKKKAA